MEGDRDEPDRTVLLAGLPGTGKTSYLALFYLAMVRGRASRLHLGGYQDDREYVNEIAGRLQRCNEALHTEVDERRELGLSIGLEGRDFFLRVPDLSGERWEQVLHDRRWDGELGEHVASATGTIIFLHVSEFDSGVSIAAEAAAAEALGETVDSSGGEEALISQGRAPAQVEFVDLLQLLCEQDGGRSVRVSVVLSAWDLAPKGLEPRLWLPTNAPLAEQYLRSNRDWLDARLWGVSAQGGSFKDNDSRVQLAEQDALVRAMVLDSQGNPSEVDAPVLWAVGATSHG